MLVWLKWVPHVNVDRCRACGLCGVVCGTGCLAVVDGIGALVNPEACTGGAQCAAACPERAISGRWIELEGDHSIGRWRTRNNRRLQIRRAATEARLRR